MVSDTVTIVNPEGFHMRPANLFVQAMSRFQSDITLHYNGTPIDGKSIMNLMAACMRQGAQVIIECSGPDEAAMLAAATDLIRSGLGEA